MSKTISISLISKGFSETKRVKNFSSWNPFTNWILVARFHSSIVDLKIKINGTGGPLGDGFELPKTQFVRPVCWFNTHVSNAEFSGTSSNDGPENILADIHLDIEREGKRQLGGSHSSRLLIEHKWEWHTGQLFQDSFYAGTNLTRAPLQKEV